MRICGFSAYYIFSERMEIGPWSSMDRHGFRIEVYREILRKTKGRANRLCLSPSLTTEIIIVVVDGFYEWRKAGKTKGSVYIF
jgi:hypothetical protein